MVTVQCIKIGAFLQKKTKLSLVYILKSFQFADYQDWIISESLLTIKFLRLSIMEPLLLLQSSLKFEQNLSNLLKSYSSIMINNTSLFEKDP
jgi:hypothetical protein